MKKKRKVEEVIQHKLHVQNLLDGTGIIVDSTGKPVNQVRYDEILERQDIAILKRNNTYKPMTIVLDLITGFVLFNTNSGCRRLEIDDNGQFVAGWKETVVGGKKVIRFEAYGYKKAKKLLTVGYGPNYEISAWRNIYMVNPPVGRSWIEYKQEPFQL